MKIYLATFGKPRFLGIVALEDNGEETAPKGRLVVAVSHRGEEMAEIIGPLAPEQEESYRNLKTISEHGDGPVRGGDPIVSNLEFLRLPTDDDLETHASHSEIESENLKAAQELVEWHQLPLKLIDAELLLDAKKLFFYFTSEQRVDFRTLVKDLARRFRTRIELRQMGVRDEARIIKGLSSCGLPCCCSYWLNEFFPIGIKMVKEQNIALNPAKISGICGRLMCCMSFEHKVYKKLWSGLPNPGSKIKTPNGNYVVSSIDIAREALCCYKPTGGNISVPVTLFADFKQAVMNGEEWEVPEDFTSDFDLRKRCSREQSGQFSSRMTDAAGGKHTERTSYRFSSNRGEGDSADTPGGKDEKSPSAEHRDATARKRPARKRGRRGGKKTPLPDVKTSAQGSPPKKTPRQQPEKHRAEGGSKPEKAAEGTAGEVKTQRPRRRRRRPGKKSAEQD